MKLGGVSIQEHEDTVTMTVEGSLEAGEREWFEQLQTKLVTHPAFVAAAIAARYRAVEADLEMDAITDEDREAALKAYREAVEARRAACVDPAADTVKEVSGQITTAKYGTVVVTPQGRDVEVQCAPPGEALQTYKMPRELLEIVGTFLAAGQA